MPLGGLKRMSKLMSSLSKIFLSACVILFSVFTQANSNDLHLHQLWNDLLNKHVVKINEGHATQVNYKGFANDRTALKEYLNQLSGVSKQTYNSWSSEQQLAFLINAYNAFTIELILTEYPNLDSIRDLGSFLSSPWKKDFVPLLDQTLSLDDIEHGMIREKGVFDEPRIHFAVNCASIGCPALLNEAFVSERLDEQLETATLAFLGDRSRNYSEQNTLYLSPIFKWYKEDFSPGFFAQYQAVLELNEEQIKQLKTDKLKLKYSRYDWNLNDIK